jgi:hypothetical protein
MPESPPDIAPPSGLESVMARFQRALDAVEDAARRRLEAEMSLADLEEELAIMQDDRNRLAQDLDAALARASSIEKTRDEALRRIERASAGVATVLGLTQSHDERG